MAWRFKASKYKNAAPIVPKPEACIRDICVGSYQTFGNNICASAAFLAFNWEHVGSSMAVLPLDDCGRKSKTMPLLHAHSDTITDMQFSPFHDGLLLTGSQDSLVKLWHIPQDGLTESLSTPECVLSQKQRRVENVGFHPVADGLIHVASGTQLALWDLTKQTEAFVNLDHKEVIQSTSWKKDGRILATSCKDKKVRIIDPRVEKPVLSIADSHHGIKDSRVVWLGDQDRILTTGFDAARLRQVILRDVRNLSHTQKSLELDCSTGILMPLYDCDTNMLFLAGKGDVTILYMEVTDREPYFIEGLRHTGEQTKGACLAPKRALRVMEGEVNRVLQLTSSSVIPIMYQVPRKSYREFHAELFPPTSGCVSPLGAGAWLRRHADTPVPTVSLQPHADGTAPALQIHRGNLKEVVKAILSMPTPNRDEKKLTDPLIKIDQTNLHLKKSPIIETQEESDKIDFVNVKDLIKGMEKQSDRAKSPNIHDDKETNGFSKKTIDNAPYVDKNKRNIDIDKEKTIDNNMKNIENDKRSVDNKNSIIENNSRNGETKRNIEVKTVSEMKQEVHNKLPDVVDNKESLHDYENNLINKSKQITDNFDLIQKSRDQIADDELPKLDEVADGATRSNSVANGGQPPKPLPRSSISESSTEEQGVEAPKPKPRTTAAPISGYKPRLGPKPFSTSQNSQEFSFDKVFSVPVVPALQTNESATTLPTIPNELSTVTATSAPKIVSAEEKDKSLSPTSDMEAHSKDEFGNSKSDTSIDEDVNSSDSGYLPKTPSTADRRKMFETNDSGEVNVIPDRRRAYETRSLSMIATTATEVPTSPAPLRRRDSLKTHKSPDRDEKRSSMPNVTKRTSTVFGRVSKFRHLKGTPGHKSTHIENIKNVSRQVTGESNGFCANGERCAVAIGGGRVAVLQLSSPRAPTPLPALLHPAPLLDLAFDPFNTRRLLVSTDDGLISEWLLPEEGLKESTNTPHRTFSAHSDKISLIRFHRTASDVLTTASHDLTVKIWDLSCDPPKAEIVLEGHTDQIYALDWSPCGEYLATVCKDGFVRIYSPRSSSSPLRRGAARARRVVWTRGAERLVLTARDTVSERLIMLYDAKDLSVCVCTINIDVSPAILNVHIDYDSNTVFLTGRGDSTIYCYEVSEEAPYLCPLSHHRCSSLHQAVAFLPKITVDVTKVEFAKALRLTNNGTVEPLSFTVPRKRMELFQDDLFPPTLVTWAPWQTARDWFANKPIAAKLHDFTPEGMATLSSQVGAGRKETEREVPEPAVALTHKPDLIHSHQHHPDKSKEDSLIKAISSRVQMNLKLEQDNMEGVDENEWDQ